MKMLSTDEVGELNQTLRFDPPLLLPEDCEHVELGFEGEKDLMLFTNLRLLHKERFEDKETLDCCCLSCSFLHENFPIFALKFHLNAK